MFRKIFLFCPLYICLVLLLPNYLTASSIYRQKLNLNSRTNGTLNATNSKGGLDRTKSIQSFSSNTDDIRAGKLVFNAFFCKAIILFPSTRNVCISCDYFP